MAAAWHAAWGKLVLHASTPSLPENQVTSYTTVLMSAVTSPHGTQAPVIPCPHPTCFAVPSVRLHSHISQAPGCHLTSAVSEASPWLCQPGMQMPTCPSGSHSRFWYVQSVFAHMHRCVGVCVSPMAFCSHSSIPRVPFSGCFLHQCAPGLSRLLSSPPSGGYWGSSPNTQGRPSDRPP